MLLVRATIFAAVIFLDALTWSKILAYESSTPILTVVDYDRSFLELSASYEFEFDLDSQPMIGGLLNPPETPEIVTLMERRGAIEVPFVFVSFPHLISREEALEELNAQGLLPATVEELLCFGLANQKILERHIRVITLGGFENTPRNTLWADGLTPAIYALKGKRYFALHRVEDIWPGAPVLAVIPPRVMHIDLPRVSRPASKYAVTVTLSPILVGDDEASFWNFVRRFNYSVTQETGWLDLVFVHKNLAVDCDIPLAELIALGQFTYRYPPKIDEILTPSALPENPSGVCTDIETSFVHVGRPVSSEDIATYIRVQPQWQGHSDRKCWPGGIRELLAFRLRHPFAQMHFPIVALGTVIEHEGRPVVPVLDGGNDARALSLHFADSGWAEGCYFIVACETVETYFERKR